MPLSATTVTPSFLRQFAPFENIPEGELVALARDVKLLAAEKDAVLFTVNSDDGLDYFLVKGQVHLIAKDGRTNSVSAEDRIARNPLARLRPRLYTAKAAASIVYFTMMAQSLTKKTERPAGADSHTNSFGVNEITLESYETASKHWRRSR